MCRHLAYLGSARRARSLLFDAPHSLVRPGAERPGTRRRGKNNPDGWGVGWYVDGAPIAAPLPHGTPMWDDDALRAPSSEPRAVAFLAAARSRRPAPRSIDERQRAVRRGPWLFSLNGFVTASATASATRCARSLSRRAATRIEGDADTEVLFALVLDRLDDGLAPGRRAGERRARRAARSRRARSTSCSPTARAVRATASATRCSRTRTGDRRRRSRSTTTPAGCEIPDARSLVASTPTACTDTPL